MKIQVDFTKTLRPIGKLNGMNNGPVHCFTDRTKEYKEMGVEFVRFHETHSFNTKCVEIPFIFRDFSADENDPANYYFAETDAVIRAAVDAGCEIMYRLGMGTESSRPRLFLEIPKDYAKWARIAEHIIAHYTEGWANGFHYENIKYLEVWNEADLVEYWPAETWPDGRRLFIGFYEETAKLLKARFPHLRVGPCGWAGVYVPEKPEDPQKGADWQARYDFFHDFLANVKEKKVPMDFFAWHTYSANSAVTERKCRVIRALLTEYGMQDVELINSEWANLSLMRDKKGVWSMEKAHTMYSAVGTSASMIVMQKYGNTAAGYYDSDERSKFCLLYDFNGNPLPAYYPMVAWKWLKEGENESETEGDTPAFRSIASFNGKCARVMLANEGEEEKVTLSLNGLSPRAYERWLYDKDHKLEKVGKGAFSGRALSLTVPKESVVVLKFEEK